MAKTVKIIFEGETIFDLPKGVEKKFDQKYKKEGLRVSVTIETALASHTLGITAQEMASSGFILSKEGAVPGRYRVKIGGLGEFSFTSLKKKDLEDIKAGKAKCKFFDIGYGDEYYLSATFDAKTQAIKVSLENV